MQTEGHAAIGMDWRTSVRAVFAQVAGRAMPPQAHAAVPQVRAIELGPDDPLPRLDRPAVFRGAARSWGCAEWTLASLGAQYSDDRVWMPDGFVALSDAVRHVFDGGPDAIRFWPLFTQHPELLDALDLGFLARHRSRDAYPIDQGIQVFAGTHHSEPTPLHIANDSNLFVQCEGSKRWVLYPASATRVLGLERFDAEYRRPADAMSPDRFDPLHPDPAHPAAALPSLEIVLNPGDVLYAPPFWWHTVQNVDGPTLAFGVRWVDPVRCLRNAPALALLDLGATRPPIWRSLAVSRRAFPLVFLEHIDPAGDPASEQAWRASLEAGFAEYARRMQAAGLGLPRPWA